ncbi:MAG: glycine cleavage system aminomethyltransferase GcvT, partial [Actinobacteria bacterium]|nr:glycine cleavage system aminomethyltransferase GcvT [Actinomycetota bacterium]
MSADGEPKLRRTPLFEAHRAAGARLVGFAGWEMPVQYESVIDEHMAVRTAAGMFDVSHMGEIESHGPEAFEFLQRLLSNDLEKLSVGGGQYSLICREDGGVLDDLFTYRLAPDRYLTVTNASNHDKDLAWFRRQAEDFDVAVVDRLDDYAMLAVQGPLAREMVQAISSAPLPARMTVAERVIAGHDALVCGTGYTGEDGVELLLAPEHATEVWEQLVARGARPAGLGARDTLRIEVCYPLYGQELTEDRGPIEAGLGWCAKEETGFIGADAVRAVRESGPTEKLAPFKLTGTGVPRPGNPVLGGGEVTSGTFSPSLRIG